MTSHFTRIAGLLLVTCLISACGSSSPGTSAQPSVAVSTIQPVRRPFTHTVAAIGSAISNPRHARHLSLAHGGKVVAVLVSDGQSVDAGQTLLKVATAPATRKAFQQARSALALARDQLARDQQLAAHHLATKAQVEAARKAVSDAQVTLQAQRQLGGGKPVDTVTAPTAGVITSIQVTRGQRVPANASLATFTPDHGLIAQLGVQVDQASRIAPGMAVTLHAVYGSSGDAHGKVSMVGHAVNPATHLVPVQVTLPSAWAAHLVAGAALAAHIQTATSTAWAIPRNALQSDAHGDYVFQIEHGTAHRVDVQVLAAHGSPIGVTGALDPHAPVITLGSYEVSEGEAVQPGQSAAPRTGGTQGQ